MSLCSVLDPLEDFLLAATTGGPGHGLNLSTNNGLDLTCQNYEGLNLSQHANHLQQDNSSTAATGDPVVLNLTHQSVSQQLSGGGHIVNSNTNNSTLQPHTSKGFTQREQQQIGHPFVHNAEVGLNLSLQNGINLSRQAVQQGNRSNLELGCYYNDFNNINGDGGATHSMQTQGGTSFTFNPRVHVDNSTYNVEQQRNSPLNLEHRSSPLNLTSVVQHQQQQQHHATIRNINNPNQNLNTSTTSNSQQNSVCQNIPQSSHHQQQQNQNYFTSNDQFNWSNLFYSQTEGGSHENAIDMYQQNDTVIQQGQEQHQMFDMGDPNSMSQVG